MQQTDRSPKPRPEPAPTPAPPLIDMSRVRRYIEAFFKWGAFALLTGALVGGIGALFCLSVVRCDEIFQNKPWLVWLLPLGGLFIAALYAGCKQQRDAGTNGILSAVRTNERIPPLIPPLIFVATCATHIFGGSSGKEGAALQLGGGLSHTFGRWLRVDEKDTRIMTMCGMSAAFSAVFCTPLTAALFAMEITSIGVMYYAALLPCAVSALTAYGVARLLGVHQYSFALPGVPEFAVLPSLRVLLLAVACALMSILFCIVIHKSASVAARTIKNHYLRIVAGSAAVIALTHLVGNTSYNGSGMNLVSAALAGSVPTAAFALKLLFTAVTIGSGFKGGEMVPLFAVGATFGCALGGPLGLDPAFAAGLGLIALFCGATNCPMSALLLAVELFEHSAGSMLYVLLAVAVSYLLSGAFGLYHEQKLVYSKLKAEFIDMKVH